MTRNAPRGAFLIEVPAHLIYALVMRAYLVIASLLLPFFAFAGVYRWVGPDGQVNYSDRPQTGAERVRVRDHRRIAAAGNEESGEESDTDLGPYRAFEISRPTPNETLRDVDAKLELSLLIDPPLSAAHRVQVLLDGQKVPGDTRQTQIQLRDLAYGSHGRIPNFRG